MYVHEKFLHMPSCTAWNSPKSGTCMWSVIVHEKRIQTPNFLFSKLEGGCRLFPPTFLTDELGWAWGSMLRRRALWRQEEVTEWCDSSRSVVRAHEVV